MTPEEFTKTQTVNVIYDPNGQHILEKHVYELMQDYTEQQLAIQRVSQQRELLNGFREWTTECANCDDVVKKQVIDDYLETI
tara:strand:- start:872 stop:1117 length:246 start_codon:yes stop_codon:yes gene_type:complete